MSHDVPDFELENEDYNIPSTSTLAKHSADDEIMELLWQNNAPVAVNMSSWLHYPIEEFYNEFLYTNPNTSVPPPTAVIRPPPENHQLPPPSPGSWPENHPPMPPQPPPARWSIPPTRGFPPFSRMVGSRAVEPPLPRLMSLSTVVDSNDTPISSSGTATLAASCPMESVVVTSSTPKPIPSVRQSLEIEEGGKDESKTSTSSSSANNSSTVGAAVTTQSETGMRTVTSEVVDGKRKSREVEESFTTTTATTTVNTHTETDKASMLEEAIEYMKSLQMQVQIMSMGCGMMPMMYPRMQQQYMPPPMGMGMGLGMRMDLGMTRPVVPYAPAMPPPPASPAPPAANMVSPLAAGMPVTHYAVPLVPSPQLSVNQPNIPADPSGSSYAVPTPGMTPIVNMPNSYQQYLAYQQMQMQAGQRQTFSQPGSSKPDASKSEGDNENNDDAQ